MSAEKEFKLREEWLSMLPHLYNHRHPKDFKCLVRWWNELNDRFPESYPVYFPEANCFGRSVFVPVELEVKSTGWTVCRLRIFL